MIERAQEHQAQQLLRANGVEVDIQDPRDYLQIARSLGLVSMEDVPMSMPAQTETEV